MLDYEMYRMSRHAVLCGSIDEAERLAFDIFSLGDMGILISSAVKLDGQPVVQVITSPGKKVPPELLNGHRVATGECLVIRCGRNEVCRIASEIGETVSPVVSARMIAVGIPTQEAYVFNLARYGKQGGAHHDITDRRRDIA